VAFCDVLVFITIFFPSSGKKSREILKFFSERFFGRPQPRKTASQYEVWIYFFLRFSALLRGLVVGFFLP